MDLSIIIVNYKSRAKLLNCLASLATTLPADLKQEIIVVDNASGDDLSDLTAQYPGLQLVISASNLGMGGGNNLGLDIASGDYILVLNPDTVVKPAAVSTLLDYLKNNPQVGLVGPKLLYPDGSLQYSCSRFPEFFMPILRRTFLGEYFKASRDSFMMTGFNHQEIKEVDWLMGSCLMFRRHLALPDGSRFPLRFDERYFMYFEDTDIGRTVWTKGFKVVYNPQAVITHDHQRESARHPWYIALLRDRITWIHIISWLKYFKKWGFKSYHI
jgi:hypothetical protein